MALQFYSNDTFRQQDIDVAVVRTEVMHVQWTHIVSLDRMKTDNEPLKTQTSITICGWGATETGFLTDHLKCTGFGSYNQSDTNPAEW